MLPHSGGELTGNSRKESTGILRGRLPASFLAPLMGKDLPDHVRSQLKELKASSKLNDTEIAEEMERRRTSGKRVYQQKVSDYFSAEMKNPPLDFLSLLCAALGVSLSSVIATSERQAAKLHTDDDWEWLMFGRRLGPERRGHAVKTIEGDQPPVVASAPLPRRTRGR